MNKLFSELKRRNVLRVGALYLVTAWLIAQVAEVVAGLGDFPPAVGRTILIILALGFPVAVTLAWAFEWTPAGIRRESETAGEAQAEGAPRNRLDYVIVSLLSVALLYFVVNHDWQRGEPQATGVSIAVLPFEHRSAQADDLYFTDGVHDDLLTQLAKISALTVISRTSVMRYRDTKLSIPDIARELGVATILEGGVQRAGNRVRINLQLIEAATDRHLWAETYDRELTADNVFAIQSEIATSIAGLLHATLLPGERERIEAIPTRSLEAYDAYLLGRRDMARRTVEELRRAREYFQEAIELDAGFALAYAGLADSSSLLSEYGVDGNFLAEAESAARKALELHPELGEAHTSLGLVRRFRGEPPEDYGPDLERGVQLTPGSSDARKWYANYLAEAGRHEEALPQLRKAAELDPMSPIVRVNIGQALLRFGRTAEAIASFEKALEIDPGFAPALYFFSTLGNIDRSLIHFSRAYRAGNPEPWTVLEFTFAYLLLGDPHRAEQWAAHLGDLAPDSVPATISRLNSNLYAGRSEASDAAAALLQFESSGLPVPSRILMLHDLARGDPETARLRYEQKYPELMADDPQVADNYRPAIDIAILFKSVGDGEKANRLLNRALQYIETQGDLFEHGIFAARAHALKGDGETALLVLGKAIDAGWRTQWWFYMKLDPAFNSVRDDPRFRAMVDEMDATMAAALANVRKLEASGDIVLPPGA